MSEMVSPGIATRPAAGMSIARLRLLGFAAISAFIVGGPVAEQVFGLNTVLFRSWIMFSTPGLGMIDARFSMVSADGAMVPLDRFMLLDEPRSGKLRWIETRDELASVTRRLCAAAGDGADIRITARRAITSGWQTIEMGAVNVCAR